MWPPVQTRSLQERRTKNGSNKLFVGVEYLWLEEKFWFVFSIQKLKRLINDKIFQFIAKYVYKIGSLDDFPVFPLSLFDYYKNDFWLRSHDKGRTSLALNVEQLLKREILEYGPVMLCFNVFEGFLHYYEGLE
jgi:hypothetical protein